MQNLNVINSKEPSEKKIENSEYSPSLILVSFVLAFIMFGLIMLYSTSSGTVADKTASLFGLAKIPADFLLFVKQSMWALVGTCFAMIIYWAGYKRLADNSQLLMFFAICGLAAALCFPEVKGARRWIKLPGMSIQPSEFAKIAVIIYVSNFLAKRQRFIDSMKRLWPALVWISIVLGLIILGKNLGTTLLLTATIWLMCFAAGMKLRYLLLPPAVLLPLLSIYIYFFDPMRLGRIMSFLDPEKVKVHKGYQLWHSLLALGSGNWLGLGFTKSRMKARYLPEAHTDCILSIVGEELGFVAMMFIILGYIIIMFTGIWISTRTENKAHMLLGLGATSLLTLQAFINLGVVSGALPTKGMPAPFISYGGSNMVMSLCCVGLLLLIEKERKASISNF